MENKIGIIGSINTDIVCETEIIPKVGETVIGNNFSTLHGGKGANEAVAAARLGASVNLIACVGDDDFSKNSIKNLKSEKIDTDGITSLKNTKGGIANITISNKNNQIIVIPGANEKLSPDLITKNTQKILECDIVGSQFEVPIDSVLLASQICKKNNIKFVLNPSPLKNYPHELFDNATFVIVAINKNLPINKSIEFANICAGLKTTKLGAQTGMPTIKEVKKYIKDNHIQITI